MYFSSSPFSRISSPTTFIPSANLTGVRNDGKRASQHWTKQSIIFSASLGKWVPNLARRIHDRNQDSPDVFINLAGMGIGDGFMSPRDTAVYAEVLYEASLVDEPTRDRLLGIEDDVKDACDEERWQDAFNVRICNVVRITTLINAAAAVTNGRKTNSRSRNRNRNNNQLFHTLF